MGIIKWREGVDLQTVNVYLSLTDDYIVMDNAMDRIKTAARTPKKICCIRRLRCSGDRRRERRLGDLFCFAINKPPTLCIVP